MIRGRILVLAALGLSACEFPTEPPMWEQTWVVEGEDITLGAGDVLPTDVSVSDDGTEFVATIEGVSFDMTLAEMCSACVLLDGLVAPKPEFSHTFTTSVDLPASLVSAAVTGDQFAFDLAHDLNFDPLRPSDDPDAERGFIAIEITSGTTVVGRDTIHGDDVAFPAGTPLSPVIDILPGSIADSLEIELTIFSPAGDAQPIETSDSLGVELLPSDITLSEATVEAGAITVNADAGELDMSGVDSTFAGRMQSGALRLEIVNPFELEGALQLEFDLGTSTIQKSFTLISGASEAEISFTGDELSDLLSAGTVAITAEGTLASPDDTITVEPDDVMSMAAELEFVILVGGTAEEDN